MADEQWCVEVVLANGETRRLADTVGTAVIASVTGLAAYWWIGGQDRSSRRL